MWHHFMPNIITSITGISVAVILNPRHIIQSAPQFKVTLSSKTERTNHMFATIRNPFASAVQAAPYPSFYAVIKVMTGNHRNCKKLVKERISLFAPPFFSARSRRHCAISFAYCTRNLFFCTVSLYKSTCLFAMCCSVIKM